MRHLLRNFEQIGRVNRKRKWVEKDQRSNIGLVEELERELEGASAKVLVAILGA